MPDSDPTGFDPVAERMLAEQRVRRRKRLSPAERLTYRASSAGVAVAALAFVVFGAHRELPATWVVALLLLAFAAATRLEFEIGTTGAVATELVFIEMLFLLPPAQVPLWIVAGNLLGRAPEYLLRIIPPDRMLIAIGNSWYAFGPALVFELFGAPRPTADGRTAGVLALALAAQFAADLGSSTLRERAAHSVRAHEMVSPLAFTFGIDLVLAPLGYLTAIVAASNELALLLPLPLLAMIGLSTRERRQRLDQALELSSAYRGTAVLLGDVVEADDAYTGAHSRDVLDLVLAVADELKVDARQRLNAEFAALLHDIGKIKVPSAIINKRGPLTPEERAIIEMHTIEGQRLLERVGGRLAEVGRIVRSSHERWDGGGYPDGLAGEEIPLVARVVCCCDAFSAMTTDRPYRAALGFEAAIAELAANAGTQFDPRVVGVLLRLVDGSRAPERPAELGRIRALAVAGDSTTRISTVAS